MVEPDMNARDVIGAQLALGAVVWDLPDGAVRECESRKLFSEMELYGIQKLEMPDRMKNRRTPDERVSALEHVLGQRHVPANSAVLVSADAGFVNAVCGRNFLAVVYYEEAPQAGGAAGGQDVGQAVGAGVQCAADFVLQGFWEAGVQFFDRVLKRHLHLPWTILYTERTVVKEICPADLDELYELYAGEGITDYTEPLYEREREEAYIRDYIDCMYSYYGYGMWIVRDRADGRLVGRAGLDNRADGDDVRIELGYLIARACQNRGYATEVCGAILDYAAEELGVDTVYCYIHPENAASLRVAEKLGFLYDGDTGEGGMRMKRYARSLATVHAAG